MRLPAARRPSWSYSLVTMPAVRASRRLFRECAFYVDVVDVNRGSHWDVVPCEALDVVQRWPAVLGEHLGCLTMPPQPGVVVPHPGKPSAVRPYASRMLFKNARAFETWLKKNHGASEGLWLKISKRGAKEPSVTCPEAVKIALCWGWIDGQKKGLDEAHYLQRFTPRRARSIWSKINVEKVASLIEAGRMQAPGYAQIAKAAKADGRWAQAYDGARTSAVPEDL